MIATGRATALVALLLIGWCYLVTATCPGRGFSCMLYEEEKCIEDSWLCDDFDDCDDGADEAPELCSPGETSSVRPPQAASTPSQSSSDHNVATLAPVTASDEDDSDEDSYEYDDDYDDTGISFWGWGTSGDSGSDDKEEDVVYVEPEPEEVPEMCSLRTCNPGRQLSYSTGRVYRYRYTVDAGTQVLGTSDKEAKFTVETDIGIKVLTACELELEVTSVEVVASRSDGQSTTVTDHPFITDLMADTLRFTIHEGLVDTVCPRRSETLESLNFKRGLLALLQNTMPRFDLQHTTREVDVLGMCDVTYRFAGTNNTELVIEKTKDLDSCSKQMSVTSSIKSVPYAFVGGLQRAPVLQSSSVCTQGIKNKQVTSVECTEVHRLTPFSSGAGGAVTTVRQHLQHYHTSFNNPRRGAIHGRTSLVYDHFEITFTDNHRIHEATTDAPDTDAAAAATAAGEELREQNLEIVQTLLDNIADYLRDTRTNVARTRDFASLVTALRRLTEGQLVALVDQPNWGRDWLVFQDAVSSVGTAASVGLMKHMLTTRPRHERGRQWLQSLALIPRPDLATIEAATGLLLIPGVDNQAYLGVSALLSSYCHHAPACQTHAPVQGTMAALGQFLQGACLRTTSPDKIQTLMALKGVGNAGQAATEQTAQLLQHCFAEVENENEIRVAAINAFRRFPCNLTRPLEDVFLNDEEDSEVRISAYLGVMRCADYDTTALVKGVLDSEEVNQVGSFIWTHLSNLQEGALPSRAPLQGLLSNLELKEKFSTDVRKFSRNYEWSAFYDPLNIGASVEGNVIFSQRSYIPRSASLNFTTDLFGQSINWLELETRVEGLERPLEDLMMGGMPEPVPASRGVRNSNVRTIIEQTRAGERYRAKDPEVSLSMKIMGQDVFYQHLHGTQPLMAALASLDPRVYIERLNRGETLSLQQSSQPIDSSGRLATSAGLPVTVAVMGTLTLDISVRATIEVGSLHPATFDPQFDIRGTLIPSVSSDVTASLAIDGIAALAGVEVDASLSSSSTLEGRITARGLSTFSLDVNVPSEKMEMVNVTSRLVLLHGFATPEQVDLTLDREVLESDHSSKIETNDCTLYSDEVGAQFCWSALFPNITMVEDSPSFPLTGSAHLKLVLNKTDPELRNYQLRYNIATAPERSFVLSANTPGTTRDREHSLVLSVNSRLQTAAFKAHTPEGQFDAMGRYTWTQAVKRIDIVCQLNGQLAAEVELSLTSHEKSTKSYYKPVAKIKWMDTDLLTLEGDIEADEKVGSSVYRVNLTYHVNTVGSGQTHQVVGTIKGDFDTDRSNRNIDIVIDYSVPNSEPQTITVEYGMQDASDDGDWKFISNCMVVFSQFRTLNFLWNNSYRMKQGAAEVDIMLNFGEPYLNPDNAVHFHRSLTLLHTDELTILNSTMALRHNLRNIDIKLSGDFTSDWDHMVSTGFIFQLVSDREISSRLNFQRTPSPLLDGTGSFHLKVPTWSDVHLRMTVNETVRRQYNIYGYGSAGAHRYAEVRGTYQSDPLQAQHKLLMAVRLPTRGTTIVNATALVTWEKAYLIIEVTPQAGQLHRGIVEYSNTVDQLSVSTKTIQFELHLPNNVIKWTTDLSVGTVITISNRLQLTRSQDIIIQLTLDVFKELQRALHFTVQWDPNRNPLKKMDLTLSQDWSDPTSTSLEATAFLGMMSHTYQMAWYSVAKKVHGDTLEWEQQHRGSIVWEDYNTRQRQEVVASGAVRLVRAETANLDASFELMTPFENWRENYLKIGYSRNADRIQGSLQSRWHDDEFFDGNLLTEKSYSSLREFAGSTSVDIRSSFRGMAYLNTGAAIHRSLGLMESNVFIQWEEDRIELRLEGHDQSRGDQLEYSLAGQVETSLEGYRSLAVETSLLAGGDYVNAKVAAHWDAFTYELRCRANRFTATDYLNGEVSLLLPGYEPDDFSGQLRIYDSDDRRHQLLLMGKWGGRAVQVEGHITSSRDQFHGGLTIDTPFAALPHASLVLGKGFDGENHMSEARLSWGPDFNVGFELKAHANSLADFIVSATINTPFASFKEVKAEILNLFVIGTHVRCHSRIFGQVGDKRFGLGGRYEQGNNPRLRVAFEVYTPLPNLELLSLDLSDNSIHHDSEYDLKVLYGSNSPLRLTVLVMRGEQEEDWAVAANLPLSVLNAELRDARLEVQGGLAWGPEPRVTLMLDIDTDINRKLSLHARLPQREAGVLEASIGGFITTPGYEEVSIHATFQQPNYHYPGNLDLSIRTQGAGTTTLLVRGDYRSVDVTFTSPLEPFRMGEMRWRRVALDVVRESVTATLTWETGEMELAGTAHIRDGVISRLEAQLTTPWAALHTAEVTLDNSRVAGGFVTTIRVTGDDLAYVADVTLQLRQGITLQVQLEERFGGGTRQYTTDVTWFWIEDKVLLAVEVTTPSPELNVLSGKVELGVRGNTYTSLVTWAIPVGSGTLQMNADRHTASRSIKYFGALTLQPPAGNPSTYSLNVDLDNRSTDDKVDLDLSLELTSNLDNWDRIQVNGTVTQVTSEPGQIMLSLTWPNLSPVVFRGEIVHQDGFTIIKPSVSIEVDRALYTIQGEMKREGDSRLLLNCIGTAQAEGQRPHEIELHSDFRFEDNKVDGTITLKLPIAEPWTTNTATIEYQLIDGKHMFNARLLTGGEETVVDGSVSSPSDGEVEGFIRVASSLKWNNHPVRISFKQSLTDENYIGEYELDFPRHNNETDTWSRMSVKAALRHSFLPAGHVGTLTVHLAFLNIEPINIDYTFLFPNPHDMTVNVRLSYKAIALGVRVVEVTAMLPNGDISRMSSIEWSNPLWPFGVARNRTTSPDGKQVTLFELYDLMLPDRRVTLVMTSTPDQDGRQLTITTILPAGREVALTAGYSFSSMKIELLFDISWLEGHHIDAGFKWEDISSPTEKKHRLEGHFTHPFRSVALEADYRRVGAAVDADLAFYWDRHRDGEDVLHGKLQWQDLSQPTDTHYLGYLSLSHPSLLQDIVTNIELQRSHTHPLLGSLLLQYSPDRSRDLSLHFNVTRLLTQPHTRRQFVTSLLARHPHSNLQVQGSSELVVGDGLYSYRQQLSYTNATGHPFESHINTALDLGEMVLLAQMTGGSKELDLRLTVVREGAGKWRIQALSSPDQQNPLTSVIELHPLHPLVTITVENILNNTASYDHTSQHLRPKKLLIRGGIEDMRNALFTMSHVQTVPEYPMSDETLVEEDTDAAGRFSDVMINDVDFFFRLNHTRLLTSRLVWRPAFRAEFLGALAEAAGLGRQYRGGRAWLRDTLQRVAGEVLARGRHVALDLAQSGTPLLTHFRNESREFVEDFKKIYTTFNLTQQEVQLRNSVQYIISKFATTLRDTRFYRWAQARLAGGTLRARIVGWLDRAKEIYRNFRSSSGGGLSARLRGLKTALAETYDKLVKMWYLKISQIVHDFRSRLRSWLRSKWHAVYHNYKPHIITTFNNIEMAFNRMTTTVSEMIRTVREGFASYSYYSYITQYINRIKTIIDSILRRPLKENLEIAFNFVENTIHRSLQFLLREVAPFLQDWLMAVREAWSLLSQHPVVARFQQRVQALFRTVMWGVRSINIRACFINTVAFAVENGYTIVTQTALQAEHRQRKAKTKLYIDVDEGYIEMVQKLPMEWLHFDQPPKWEELKEWRLFKLVRSIFAGDHSIDVLDYWYKHFSLTPDPASWLPPFQASSMVVGQQHLVSWNGGLLEFKGMCRYVLAADLVSQQWAVVLNYHANAPNAYILYLDGKQIEMEQDFTVKIDGRPTRLPLVSRTAVVYRDGERLVLRQTSGLLVQWNQLHDVFSITVPGIYFGKLGGLLGTNNYEHLDDRISPSGYLTTDEGRLAASWSVSRGNCQASSNTAIRHPHSQSSDRCRHLFQHNESPFKYCFHQVDPAPYDAICRAVGSDAEEQKRVSCAAASALRQTCSVAGVPTKIPHDCSVCHYETWDGTSHELAESQTTVIPLEEVPKSTDVVLIIEAGACNSERRLRRNLRKFYQDFDEEMSRNGVEMSRYAVVTYGGSGFFAAPQHVLAGTRLFASARELSTVLANVAFDTRTPAVHQVDAFEALRFASNLNFRAGVTPTFLLMPCTPCLPDVGMLDFATMYHILVDRGVILHILTPAEIVVSKHSLANKILGMDQTRVYTVKDSTTPALVGDTALRAQVTDPRDELGYCSPLALQTNGSIFTTKWLNLRRRRKIEQMAVVLGRRVAQTAAPRYGQRCMCLPTADDSVRMKCHRLRPEWGDFSMVAPYFDDEAEDDYLDTLDDMGYEF